jgi:hypothetical protein
LFKEQNQNHRVHLCRKLDFFSQWPFLITLQAQFQLKLDITTAYFSIWPYLHR